MRDLIDKRNQLCRYSQRLRTLKFDTTVFNREKGFSKEKITELIDEQNKTYNKFIFYKKLYKRNK